MENIQVLKNENLWDVLEKALCSGLKSSIQDVRGK